MDCSFVEKLIATARAYTFQRIAVMVGFLGPLVGIWMSLAHPNVDLPSSSQNSSMLLLSRHFYPQSMDCPLVGLLIAAAYRHLYLYTLFSSLVMLVSMLPAFRHIYPQSMDCSLVRRFTASACMYPNLSTLLLQATGCFVCVGSNMLLHCTARVVTRIGAQFQPDLLSGTPSEAKGIQLRGVLAV